MRILTSEKKQHFVDEIKTLRQQLDAFKPENTLRSLERFENQLTLNAIEACFVDSEPETQLVRCLSTRWERIRNSNLCYTQQPTNAVNQLCLDIAKAIAPPAATASEIEALAPNAGPYCLLMPSLENTEDSYFENIHACGLHDVVLSDNERVFIPVAKCLHQASVSDEGQLRRIVALDRKNPVWPELTPSEIERVSHHSKQAYQWYQALIAFNKQRLIGDDIGAKLSQLASALRRGGEHNILGSGSAFNAGSEASLGILAFREYLDTLPAQQQSAIFTESPELKDILGRLFRPDDENYQEVRFCVELLAEALDPTIERYNQKPTIQALKDCVEKQEQAFEEAAQCRDGLAIIQKKRPPKHILHLIFKLSSDEQALLFKHRGYDNALMRALALEPEALTEFELDEAAKRQAVSVRVNSNGDSALIVAAKQGKTDAIKLLLSWGAQIESHDVNHSTALHWAANNGHVDAVHCLLDHGALLEARGAGNNTALNFAVIHGKGAVVELLLKKNADVNARREGGMNALDLAIAYHPEFIEPILINLATLPVDKQAECLLHVPGGPYPNVLCYAASYGHIQAVTCLLENGASLKAEGYEKNTALHFAVRDRHRAVVELLLKKNADVNARNKDGVNALDMAINKHPEFIELILIHLTTLPENKQTECLQGVPGGPYPNALIYAVIEKPSLLNGLVLLDSSISKDHLHEITGRLTAMHFDEHLQNIRVHYHQQMKEISRGNSNYTAATVAARTLLQTCAKAKITLFQSADAMDIKISAFKLTCKNAIETAKPILKKYRKWDKVLAAFLLAIMALPVSLPLYAIGFFSMKTKSVQLLDKLQDIVVDKPDSHIKGQ